MHRFSFTSRSWLIRSVLFLTMSGAIAFGALENGGSAGAQSTTTATTTPTPSATTTAASTAATTTTPTPAATSATFTIGEAVVVNADKLNFRASASIDAAITDQLLDGTWGTIAAGPTATSDGYTWYQITVNDVSGWVDGAYLADTTTGDAATLPVGSTVVVTSDSLNFRSTPSTTGAILSTLASGDMATVTGAGQSAGGYVWYQLDVNGVTGWAARDFLAFAPADVSTATAGASVIVNTNALILRDSPSATATELSVIPGGTQVTLVAGPTAAGTTNWYQVSDGSTTGWVSGDYLRTV